MANERRKRTRVGYHGWVELWVDDIRLPLTVIRDISTSGLFVVTEALVPLGRKCEVVIHLGPSEDQVVRVEGQVARHEEGGLGIGFESIDPDSYAHLRNVILYNAQNPDRVEAELNRPGIR